MATSPIIPLEILEDDIFTRLPVKSLSKFRCVCKYWCNDLFQNARFIKNHLNHANQINKFNLLVSEYKFPCDKPTETGLYSVDHNVLSSQLGDAVDIDYPLRSEICLTEIHGSCNGLLCIEPFHNDICIWNPCTKEFKQVPETPIGYPSLDANRPYDTTYGFGYDCKIDDYKLLRIMDFYRETVSEARVYTLGSNSWKSLGIISNVFSVRKKRGLFVDGALHWLARSHDSRTETRVVSFNICEETFRHTPLPDHLCISGFSDMGTWEGKVCIVLVHEHDDKNALTVWTMKDYTWSKHFNITEQINGTPIQIFQNGKILFKCYLWKENKTGFISYDPKIQSARVLKIGGLADPLYIEPYIQTLVSLKSGTFVGQK